MLVLKRFILLGFVWGTISLGSLSAQVQLERISITERSDGNGYVIRYHLTEMVDSYDLIQPEPNRIQMQLFSPDIDAEGVQLPETNEEIIRIDLVSLENGIGVDIETGPGVFFRASAYPDQNLRHLLLGLAYGTRAEAEALASQAESHAWSIPSGSEEGPETVIAEEPERRGDEAAAQRVQRNPAKVSFGFSGGLGIANKIGGGYTSESRQELTMGLTASIGLPFVLPYDLSTGIETGIFYTQKGFQNPSSARINAQTVVLDYIEVPILGKLSYDMNEKMKPHLLGGFYTAFRTAAETVQPNGNRGNLDGVTSSVDMGLIAGIGSDFVLDMATISIQIRYGVGVPRMFDEGFSGRERPGYLSLLLGFKF